MHNKGTWIMADAVPWLLYVSMTAIIVMALVIIPTNILQSTVQPVELDASIMEERLAQKITAYSPVLGTQPGQSGDLNQARLAMSEKRHAYKVTMGAQSVVGNQDFYDEAIPLTPIKHRRFTYTTTLQGVKEPVTIDQVYPERYG